MFNMITLFSIQIEIISGIKNRKKTNLFPKHAMIKYQIFPNIKDLFLKMKYKSFDGQAY